MASCAQKGKVKRCKRVKIKRGKGRGKMKRVCYCAKKRR